ncbi:hypothetical protein VTN49DRAFT_1295 [Thermomyces lanuginosus]|uniref:uncharacterized protein n=1 Tax=Thermomyces lanuginosus TaxID=5541 RepID=UPI003743EF5D
MDLKPLLRLQRASVIIFFVESTPPCEAVRKSRRRRFSRTQTTKDKNYLLTPSQGEEYEQSSTAHLYPQIPSHLLVASEPRKAMSDLQCPPTPIGFASAALNKQTPPPFHCSCSVAASQQSHAPTIFCRIQTDYFYQNNELNNRARLYIR